MTPTTYRPFDSQAAPSNPYAIGADALLYVMAYGHAISVPDLALAWAEKVGVISIASRDTPEPVLRDVNRALDVIARTLRLRLRLGTEVAPMPAARPPDRPNEGPMATLKPTPTPYTPISGMVRPF